MRFDYLLDKNILISHILRDEPGDLVFEGVPIHYFRFFQGNMPVNGFRFGSLAYISDIRSYSPTILHGLKGIKKLVLSALRFTASDIHFSIDEAIEFSRLLGSPQTWLTHLSHELDYEKTNAYLPENIRLAYDGLKIPFSS